jgi:hypothetical protein
MLDDGRPATVTWVVSTRFSDMSNEGFSTCSAFFGSHEYIPEKNLAKDVIESGSLLRS